jgi:hypothetical protein
LVSKVINSQNIDNQFNFKQIKKELFLYRTTLEKKTSQALFYFMNKTVTRLLDGLYIDLDGLQNIKKLTERDRKTRIVLMPMWKSYSDLFALHYANYISDIEFGFSFIYYNDSSKVKIIESLVKKIGIFMLRPNIN